MQQSYADFRIDRIKGESWLAISEINQVEGLHSNLTDNG
jgi:hypothetical protein